MLKGLSPLLSADLLWILESMGHGDDLALVDRNFPAASTAAGTCYGRVLRLDGVDCNAAAEAILSLLPLDSFVETPLLHMQMVGEPEARLEVHSDLLAIAERAAGGPVGMGSLERQAFYAAAGKAFAVVQTLEARPYGCFLLKKGVIFD
ncbi:MAG: RbsD/FucU domain-containing protein [Rhodospirillales bacterium]